MGLCDDQDIYVVGVVDDIVAEVSRQRAVHGQNLIVIELKTDVESHRVSGTVFTDKLPRIVNIDGYPLEVVPHGNMIFFTNHDKPGVIGAIGTVLGQCRVNIAGMYLGREREGGRALALLLVDNRVSKDVIEQFRQVPNVLSAKVVYV